MDKIASFAINHLLLTPGLYVSRKDNFNGVVITTFDMRITSPNREPVIDMSALHTIEHLGATYVRNCELKQRIVYFGPMGCRTGFYLIMADDLMSQDIFELVVRMCDYILEFDADIPGAYPKECGNYLEQNLPMAKYYIKKYKTELIKKKSFTYPIK